MAYAVGQVLYVVSRRENKIVPVQVVEELTSRTLKGLETTYMVRLGDDKNVVTIDKIDGEIFESPNDLIDTLIKRASVSVQRIVAEAIQRAQAWYPDHAQVKSITNVASMKRQGHQLDAIDNETIVTLPDGTIARVKVPNELL